MNNDKNDNIEISGSGQPIYRYELPQNKEDRPAVHIDDAAAEKIDAHVAAHYGKVDFVWHEIVSTDIHLDVLYVAPSPEHAHHTFITMGMSNLPMNVPTGAEAYRYAELMICLPPQWKVDQESFKDMKYYWPIYLLKSLARFPFEYNSWLSFGHSIPNGDPAEPYHESTGFTGVVLLPPIAVAPSFHTLLVDKEKEIHFFALVPLYTEEMNFKLEKGLDALFDRFDKHGINEIVDVRRKNVCKKRFGFL